MLPKRIILIRHGEADGNVDPKVFRYTPDHAINLTDRGKIQSIQAGEELNNIIPENQNVKIYCSPYERTRRTFDNVTFSLKRKVIKAEFDPRLREREWAGWFGDYLSNPRDRVHNFFYRMQDGESCADVYLRMTSFIDSLEKDVTNSDIDNVIIISHGTAMRVFLMRWFRYDEEEFYTIPNPHNCGMYVLKNKCLLGSMFTQKYELETEIKRVKKGTVL